MIVSHIATNSEQIDQVPIVNGQIIGLIDRPGYFYDMGDSRHPVSGVRRISTLPLEGYDDIIYSMIDEDGKGILYIWDSENSEFVEISGGGGGGTSYSLLYQSEYDELTQDEKMNGTIYFVKQDEEEE